MTEDLLRLGRYVRRARLTAGLTIKEAARAAGISKTTWSNLEKGGGHRDLSRSAVEQVLGWAPGSSDAILAGGEPSPVVAGESDAPPVTQVHHGDRVTRFPEDRWARMSDAQRRALLELAELFGEENPERGVNGE